MDSGTSHVFGIIKEIGDASRDGYALIDSSYRVMWVNKALELKGFRLDNVHGEPYFRAFNGKDEADENCSTAKAFRTGKTETKLEKGSDGTEYEVTSIPLKVDGAVKYVLEISRAAHGEEKQKEDLLGDYDFFEDAISRLPEGFAAVDSSGKQSIVNDKFCSMVGFSREELLGQTAPFKYWAEENYGEIEHALRQTLEGISRGWELIFKKKSGDRFCALIFPVKISRPNGEDVFITTVKDVTEEKMAEDELLKFKLGIDRSHEVVFITDREGHITYANPQFEKSYGYPKEEYLDKTPRIIKSGILQKDVYDNFWKTLLSKLAVSGEITNKAKDGRLLVMQSSANPILGKDGEIIGFLAIQREITERKAMEDKLKAEGETLRQKIQEMERFHKVAVGRELRMIELKRKIRELEGMLEREGK